MNQLSEQSRHEDIWGLNEIIDRYYDLNYSRFLLASEVFHTSLVSVHACNVFRFEIVSGNKDTVYNCKITVQVLRFLL